MSKIFLIKFITTNNEVFIALSCSLFYYTQMHDSYQGLFTRRFFMTTERRESEFRDLVASCQLFSLVVTIYN